ncbi:MAG: Fic family protein [Lachnospiraceae bacterium]|nr:Fic family protein [Lachnospiraceae bacterium]
MRNYEYVNRWQELLSPEIVHYLTTIHEFRGEQRLIADSYADVLTDLVEIAKIQSTESSNRIEGIYTSDEQLRKIVFDKTTPKTRDEQEIAGYRDVLNTIHENYEHIPVKASFVLQLHKDLYKFEGNGAGGSYKSVDNVIEEKDEKGSVRVRFQPVPAWETPEALNRLCEAYKRVMEDDVVDPLLIIPMFVIDFLCIHPFRDGNGRMSRLLTLLLLYKAGYFVGRYISIEKLIEKTKVAYYEALMESSADWHEMKNDYAPFVKYMLGVIAAAYRDFFERTKLIVQKKVPKPDRIAEEIKRHVGSITKTELVQSVPDVSPTTVQRTLNDLVKAGRILKVGGGRYTKYKWNWEREE